MDVVGWMLLAVLLALIGASYVWSYFFERRRGAKFREWATRNGLIEIADGAAPAWTPSTLRRSPTPPSFQTTATGGRQILVLPLKTMVRFEYLWALCAQTSRANEVLVAYWPKAEQYRMFGASPKPKHLVLATPTQDDSWDGFLIFLPPGAAIEDTLSPEINKILVAASPRIRAWTVRTDDVAVLMVREFFSDSPADFLDAGLAAIKAQVPASSRGQ